MFHPFAKVDLVSGVRYFGDDGARVVITTDPSFGDRVTVFESTKMTSTLQPASRI